MHQNDLFQSNLDAEGADAERVAARAPLAHRMRPQTLAEFLGQTHLLGEGKPLRQWIARGKIPSLILWGPPGVGKTTLGRLIAASLKSRFVPLSAVDAGTKEIKAQAQPGTVLFIDEIHRLNRAQQDVLLPSVENGTITLIGATTENPSFEINSALLSRCRVLTLHSLSSEELVGILQRACRQEFYDCPEKMLARIAEASDGDARRALTLLEALAPGGFAEENAAERLAEVLQSNVLRYDSSGEEHYNVISAFIKSIRDSDADAGIYYLARMIEGGEDPLFIARRLVILAAEDVGLADPQALAIAIAVKDAVEFVGMPEGRIPLAEGVAYLARAPKNNHAYAAIDAALDEVRKTGARPVPMHLRNAVTSFMRGQGYGKGYVYAHNDPSGAQKQKHLPDGLSRNKFFP